MKDKNNLENIINSIYFILLKDNNNKEIVDDKNKINQLYNNNLKEFIDKYGYYLNKQQIIQLKAFETNNNNRNNVQIIEQYINSLEKKEKEIEIELINKRYAHMQKYLIHNDYFSIENSRKRHPYLYHCYIGRYQSNEDQLLHQEQPYERSASISERLMINVQVEHEQFDLIEKELKEIDYLTMRMNLSIQKQMVGLNNNSNIKSGEAIWFQCDNKSALQHLKDMLERKNDLIKQKNMINTVLNRKKRGRDDPEEMEEIEEMEEDEDEDDAIKEGKDIKEQQQLQQQQQKVADEDEYMDEEEIQESFDSFIDMVKDMFIHGHDQEFDYSKIDKNIFEDFKEIDEDDSYFDDNDISYDDGDDISEKLNKPTNNIITTSSNNKNSKIYNLGEEDDYDYEEEYRQSLIIEEEKEKNKI